MYFRAMTASTFLPIPLFDKQATQALCTGMPDWYCFALYICLWRVWKAIGRWSASYNESKCVLFKQDWISYVTVLWQNPGTTYQIPCPLFAIALPLLPIYQFSVHKHFLDKQIKVEQFYLTSIFLEVVISKLAQPFFFFLNPHVCYLMML